MSLISNVCISELWNTVRLFHKLKVMIFKRIVPKLKVSLYGYAQKPPYDTLIWTGGTSSEFETFWGKTQEGFVTILWPRLPPTLVWQLQSREGHILTKVHMDGCQHIMKVQ